MHAVLLVIHLMVAAALIGAVLLQHSEGGALGMGGGGGGLMTGRGTANLLTRATAVLAAAFFATSILLTILSRQTGPATSVFDQLPATAPAGSTTPAPATGTGGILDKLKPPQPANPTP